MRGSTHHIMMCAMLLIFTLQECIVHKLLASRVHCHHIFYQLTPSTMFRVPRYFPPLSHTTYPNFHSFYSNFKLHPTFTYPNPSYIRTIPHSHTLLDTLYLPPTLHPTTHTHNPRLPHYRTLPPTLPLTHTLPYPSHTHTIPLLDHYHTLPPHTPLPHPLKLTFMERYSHVFIPR